MNRIIVLPLILFALLMVIFSCQKEYSYEAAAGSLRDSFNNCSPVEISGNYRKGASLTSDSFFVTVEVNITKIGAYSIRTDLVNGFGFSSSGNFEQKGIQKVKLKAEGTPLLDTLTIFNCSFDTSMCSFSIQLKKNDLALPVIVAAGDTAIEASVDTSQTNTWYFKDLTDRTFHSGILDEKSNFTKVSPTLNYLNIVGWAGTQYSFSRDTIFTILVYLPSPEIVTGNYPITSGTGGENSLGYANTVYLPVAGAQSFFYYYRCSAVKNTDFTFKIISYDAMQNIILVNFEGSCLYTKKYNDHAGSVHHIKGGFYCKLN
jgi:hypothetical protein